MIRIDEYASARERRARKMRNAREWSLVIISFFVGLVIGASLLSVAILLLKLSSQN